MSPGETIREALTMCLRRGVTLVGIESNAYQYSLLYWFNYMTTQLGITGIEPVELYSGMIPKQSRIITMFRQLIPSKTNLPPEIYLHPSTRALIFSTISQFNPLRRDNTDGILDLLTYATKMIELYGVSIMNSNIIQEDEFNSIPISFNNSPI